MAHNAIMGLSEAEVVTRRQQGQGNVVQFHTGRTYPQILRKNAFTFINTVLFSIGIVLLLMGQFGDAVVTAGLVLLNVIVGVYQEGRAKRKLDQIALLTRPKATVIRSGEETSVDPGELVLGDVLVARPGDQIVVDGDVVGDVLSGDWRPTLLALGMLGLYMVVTAVPPLRAFFELTPLRVWDYLLIAAGVVVWALLLRLIWRVRAVERLLALEPG